MKLSKRVIHASDGLGEKFPNGPDQSMLLFKCQANEGTACPENEFDIASFKKF